MSVDLRSLIAKLDSASRGAMEGAAALCLSRTHYDVEVEHLLAKLLDRADGDTLHILRRFELDRSRLTADLSRSLDGLRSGNARTPSLSPSVVQMLSEAWMIASVDHTAREVRPGHLILALVSNTELSRLAREISRELSRIDATVLRQQFGTIVRAADDGERAVSPGDPAIGSRGVDTPSLDQYTVDLTARARAGLIDPVLGRDAEIRQVVDILTRRRQNNPILVGEAGVGKTAVAEGFARRIVDGDVPPPLRNVSLRTLDLALLQAGAGVKGEFESRLKKLIDEVKASPTPVVLFVDEAHTMIGAGGGAGQNDAANLLKPALARGELRTIAATTWSEYKKYFEKDAALTRRFQVVKVDEPTEEVCLVMLRSVVPALEAHHNVRILDDSIDAAVRLSHRYLPDRQLPDKAVSVLDTACARLALSQHATPPALEDAQRRLDDIATQARILEREQAVGADVDDRLSALAAERVSTEVGLNVLRERWTAERTLVDRIRAVRGELESGSANGSTPVLRQELRDRMDDLAALQGEAPLVRVCVDATLIGEVIAAWTGVPLGKMLRDDLATALDLETLLARRVIGQDDALSAIARRIRTARAGIEDPQKPVGVFMLVGPSGVGKTETALAMSDLLYGGERNLITINMSEFQEAHTVSTLKGSPPGYVGYGEGGVLTEAVRRRPYSVVLLDEVEKAHPDVMELFFQVFDKGSMEDGEGRPIDFRNTVIVLTTNVGATTIAQLTADPETQPAAEPLTRALRPELEKVFKAAFLGRLIVVPYLPIRDAALQAIIRLKLDRLVRRVQQAHHLRLRFDDAVVATIAARCVEVESGARAVDNILTGSVMPEISVRLLHALADAAPLETLAVQVGEDGDFRYVEQADETAVDVLPTGVMHDTFATAGA
jgi:type VI secretion system protein VasG